MHFSTSEVTRTFWFFLFKIFLKINVDKAGIVKEPPYFDTIIYSFLCLSNAFIKPLWYTEVNKIRKCSCEVPWEASAMA